MKKIKSLFMLLFLLLLAVVFVACSNDSSSSGDSGDNGDASENGSASSGDVDKILIGVPQPLTGPAAAEGQDMVNGAEIAVKHINEAGGVLGKEIELVVVDEACDPQVAVSAANKLVSDGVHVIVGHYCSASALPANDVYNKARIPTILIGANSPQIPEQGYDNIFLINSMVFDQATRANEYFMDNNIKRVALIHDNSDYARDLADATQELHEENGGEVIAFEAINPEEKDFGALATKLKSLEPDAIYFTGFYNAGGLIAKQLKQKEVSGVFMVGDGNPVEPFIEVASIEDAEGVLFTIPVSIDLVDTPEAKAFIKEYKETYNGNPLTFAHRQYDGIRLAADAIERVGDPTDNEGIIKALSETKDFPAFGETYTFREDGTREDADYLILQIVNGEVVVVE